MDADAPDEFAAAQQEFLDAVIECRRAEAATSVASEAWFEITSAGRDHRLRSNEWDARYQLAYLRNKAIANEMTRVADHASKSARLRALLQALRSTVHETNDQIALQYVRPYGYHSSVSFKTIESDAAEAERRRDEHLARVARIGAAIDLEEMRSNRPRDGPFDDGSLEFKRYATAMRLLDEANEAMSAATRRVQRVFGISDDEF